MPLILHRASRPEALVAELAALLDVPPPDPFAIEPIAVHSGGLEQWIALQVAQRNGLCAGVRFLQPEELVARLAAEALGEPTDLRGWAPGPLTWALLAELPGLLPLPALAPVREYIDAEGPTERTLRLVTLVQRLARVFQDYGTHRQALVRGWQQPHPDEPWEAPVWRALEGRLGAVHLTGWADRLERSAPRPGSARAFVFGASTLPPLVLRLLADLSTNRELHLFALHPSPVAWTRREPTHPLIASMATLAHDLRDALLTVSVVESPCAESEPPRDSLLHALQADLHDDAPRRYTADPGDRSIQVHLCTSPVRQVQALRDVLLALLDDPSLEPRDIVVMCPDIETYAPWIEAEFGEGAERWAGADAHPAGFPSLPFRLADRGVRSQNHVADALLRFLDLLDSRFEAPTVVELLALPPVRERFGLAADALPEVRALLVDAGARWGRDGAQRAALDLPDDDRFTWRFALDRLLLAQALAEPDRVMVFDHAPACAVEAKDERARLGALVDFVETLLEEHRDLAGERPLAAWFTRLALTVDRLATDNGDDAWQKRQVLDALVELADGVDSARFEDPVDLRAVRALLGDRFAAREPGRGFLSGAITVCQLVPLRSIPFRVVCLLGLDHSVFPRVQPRAGYDRMANDRQPGDRDARVDDRALFLEAIQSARETLIVTCTDRSQTTGRPEPLAVPVAELLDAVRALAGPDASARVTHHHPLQPWAPERFTRGLGRDRRMLTAAEAWRAGRTEPTPRVRRFATPLPPAEPMRAITLAELGRFWRHPPSEFVNRRLGLSLWQDDTSLSAELPFEFGPLETWQLSAQLLAGAARGEDLVDGGDLARRVRRGASLPMGTPGARLLSGEIEAVRERWDALRDLRADPQPPIDVDLHLALRVTGRVDRLFRAGRLIIVVGRIHPRDELDAWIHHLALHASGWSGATTLAGSRSVHRFRPLEAKPAALALDALCRLVGPALDAPMLFWADASFAAYQREQVEPGWGAFEGARGVWDYRNDREKQVDGWMIDGLNPFHPEFPIQHHLPGTPHPSPIELARLIWAPAIAARETLP